MKIKYLIFATLLTNSVFALEESKTVNIPLTIEQINEQNGAKHWNITRSEYALALKLKQRYQGLVSEKITPLEHLGIFAKTEQDRNKYAKLFKKIDREVTRKVLAFDKAVQKADRELFGFDDLIKYQIRKDDASLRKKITIDTNNCNTGCQQHIQQLVLRAVLNPVDFYFVNATDNQIRHFAEKLNISPDEVERSIITLNHAIR